MRSILLLGRRRLLTHLILALFAVAGCYVTYLLKPNAKPIVIVTLGTGDVGLILVVLTLLIGPWKLLQQRVNPVNIYLRRDTGIWAAITAFVHVVLGFRIFEKGQIVLYFFTPASFKPLHGPYKPSLEPFGLSNYIGAGATVVLAVLLLISNDLSVRWLKARWWKFLQRFNYLVFVLIVFHALVYQGLAKRPAGYVIAVAALTLVVVGVQAMGMCVSLYRRLSGLMAAKKSRKPAT